MGKYAFISRSIQTNRLTNNWIMGDRYNIHSQLEHLQSKYIGTGHADTSRYEWLSNQHRDSYASYVGHFDVLNYIAIAENESKARVRFNLMEKMLQPCGPPTEKSEDWKTLWRLTISLLCIMCLTFCVMNFPSFYYLFPFYVCQMTTLIPTTGFAR